MQSIPSGHRDRSSPPNSQCSGTTPVHLRTCWKGLRGSCEPRLGWNWLSCSHGQNWTKTTPPRKMETVIGERPLVSRRKVRKTLQQDPSADSNDQISLRSCCQRKQKLHSPLDIGSRNSRLCCPHGPRNLRAGD